MGAEGSRTYVTVRGRGEARFEEKRSVFIGYCIHAETEEEALSFVREIKEKHRDATHNVFGYVMRAGILCRYSDDGEPQGTAGKPVLDVIKKMGVDDVCVVVTRYFGGTLLGTGGLVHAYGLGAKLALEAAGIASFEEYSVYEITLTYSEHQRISLELERAEAIIDDVEYSDHVSVRFALKKDSAQSVLGRISELLAGRSSAVHICDRFDAKPTK